MSQDLVTRAVFAALEALSPESERDALVGDLHEEWATIVLPERGPAAARAWLVRQAAHSVLPLLALRVRRGGAMPLLAVAVASVISAAVAIAAAETAWRLILFHVPLRASHAPPLYWIGGVVVVTLAVASITAVLAASFLGLRRRRPS